MQEGDFTHEEESDLSMKEPSVEMVERLELSLNSVIGLRNSGNYENTVAQ